MNFFTTLLLLIVSGMLLAQPKVKFGDIDKEYFEMTHCPIDSSTGAFIILAKGVSRLDYNYEIEFIYHAQIKILNSSEFDRADIKIPFSGKDRVGKFKASTFNMENGKIVESKITRKDALIEEEKEGTKSFNFTFPNVKEGSIIEYEYSVNYGSIRRLNTWYFQTSIPTLRSEYEVVIPAFLIYERLSTGLPLQAANIDYENKPFGSESISHQVHTYAVNDMPAFKDEPFLTAENDYLTKIDFELKKTTIPGDIERTYMPSSYSKLASNLYSSDSWHERILNSKFTKDEVALLKSSSDSDLSTAEAIFYFVRDNFDEDYDVDFSTLRRVYEEQKGSAQELNMVLASMLNQAGFDVNLVLLSTRPNGKIHPYFPIMRKFNHTIVRVKLGEDQYLMDASDKNTPFNSLPKYCLNERGLVIAPTEEWVELKPSKANSTTYSGNFNVTGEGILEGDLTIRRSGYEAWEFQSDLEDEGVDEYKKSFNEARDTWVIEGHEIGDLKNHKSLDEKLEIQLEDRVDDLGDILYLNPIVIGQMTDNPLKSEERIFPVNYGAPYTITHLYKFKLDDAFIVEELPPAKTLALPGRAGQLLYSITNNDNELTLTFRFKISKSEFSPEEYPYLREFYAQTVAKHGEQIVIRRK